MESKKGAAWILILVIVILVVVGGYFGYQALNRTKIISVNFVELDYEIAMEDNSCDKCLKGYYLEDGEKVCPSLSIDGEDVQDCLPHEVLCVGPGIKSNYNLVVENYKEPIDCKIISTKGDGDLISKGINYLTNAIPSNEGINNADEGFRNSLDREYQMRICCSLNENFDTEIIPYDELDSRADIVCGHDTILDKRC